jgi:hypothetical protein
VVKSIFLRVEICGVYNEDCMKDEICDVNSHIYGVSASEESDYISGTAIVIDGGRLTT